MHSLRQPVLRFAAFRSSARSVEVRKFDNRIHRTCSYRIRSYSFLCFVKSKTLNILSTLLLLSRFRLEHDHVQMQSFPFSLFGAIEVYRDLKSRLCWGLDVHKVSSGSEIKINKPCPLYCIQVIHSPS
ncbi:hypothetical protein PVK06_033650 [Gossypium arboreum]|uniref:Uncharacterized protein n=1 Tax=Gossypium arboreum TaxID=29729 RepID=A0ABR0NCD1_GOSAR|nr:hypothetical protein PVK06_033650 [Gossypium arboreum]